jgi:hypothetical protein
MALPYQDRALIQTNGNLDVTVLFEILTKKGYSPEFVSDLPRATQLSMSSLSNGPVFIPWFGDHYVSFRLSWNLWWKHDSLNSAPEKVLHTDMLNTFHSLTLGNLNRFGRRLIYFHNAPD